jgi:hypothetical protein
MKDAFKNVIPQDELEVIDGTSDHDYRCNCNTCLRWWVLMGPDGGEPGKYGPFTREQVIAEANAWGKPVKFLT